MTQNKSINKVKSLLIRALKTVPNILDNPSEMQGYDTHIPLKIVCSNLSPEEKEVIQTYELYKPQKLIEFLLDMYFSCFEDVAEGISSVRNDILNQTISKVKSDYNLCVNANLNQENKQEYLQSLIKDLSFCMSSLETHIMNYAQNLHEIDRRTGISKIMHIFSDFKTMPALVDMATRAMMAYLHALSMLSVIGTELSRNVSNFFKGADIFFNKLQSKKICSLFAAYDVSQDNTYWNTEKILSVLEETKVLHLDLAQYLMEETEVEVDYEELFD